MTSITETSPKVRVMIVDDHPLLREGMRAVIENEADMMVVAEACDGREAIDVYEAHQPDVTVMDLQMPELDGVAATAAIRSRWPDARILILTTYQKDIKARAALRAGATGYLLKNMIRTELLQAIRELRRGRRFLPREIADDLATHLSDEVLSAREIEVLRHVAQGNSNRRIADKLSISEDTVKAHVANVMGKLFANDRTHAVTIAMRRGFLDLS